MDPRTLSATPAGSAGWHHITPSEAILLEPRLVEITLATRSTTVLEADDWRWASATLMVAFLAVERAGGVVLEQGEVAKRLGLGRRQALVASTRRLANPWPYPSLEGRLHALTRGPAASVDDVVYEWLDRNSLDPAADAVDRAIDDLHERAGERRGGILGRLTRSRRVPRERVVYGFTHSVESLVVDCQARRAAVWDSLTKAVERGVSRRMDRSIGA